MQGKTVTNEQNNIHYYPDPRRNEISRIDMSYEKGVKRKWMREE